MEVENQTPTPETPVEPAAAVEPAEGGAEGSDQVDYTPNFKFKYRGVDRSEQEAEIDDFLKPIVKDAATEKKLRDLYEKAHGLDFVKSDRDHFKTNHSKVADEYQTQSQALRTLGTFVQNKDYDSFFEALKIPKKDVLDYALQMVQVAKMSPEEQAQFNSRREESQRMVALQMQNSELTQQFHNLAVQGREQELNGVMGHPQIAPLVNDFDQRAGRPGAFRELVIQKGQHHFFSSGVDVPVGQAVNEVIQLLGLKAQQPAGTPGGAAPRAQANGKPPVLPNVPSRGTSPAKKVPRSVDDLRKLASQLAADQ